jgi:hypothetical protein
VVKIKENKNSVFYVEKKCMFSILFGVFLKQCYLVELLHFLSQRIYNIEKYM